jgi:hypothetical protein
MSPLAFFNLGLAELIVLLGIGFMGAVAVGVVVFLTTSGRGRRPPDDWGD